MKRIVLGVFIYCCLVSKLKGQAITDEGLSYRLNESGSSYLKLNLTTQMWLRLGENNPGSTQAGFVATNNIDVGIRRSRLQLYGMLNEKSFIYTQIGINNFGVNSSRKPGLFFHDVVGEYHLSKRTLHLGMGLSGWGGMSRFSSPAVANIMGLDVPLFLQTTNDVSDQFLRKLGVYGKGKLGKLDYRIMLSTPMAIQYATGVNAIDIQSDFSLKPAAVQSSAYVMYQFLDEESNLIPYTVGTYMGKKRVFNIGVGFQYQKDAMWHLSDTLKRDTISEPLLNIAIDAFYDAPIGRSGAAISLYAAVVKANYGKNYVRNNAPMNLSDAVLAGSTNGSGPGTAFPMFGTGNVFYLQGGYLLPNKNNKVVRVMPYFMLTHAKYDKFNDAMNVFDLGLNFFLKAHKTKVSLDYQNRPIYNNTNWRVQDRLGLFIVQLQMAI
jgi:hypothetical protein